MSITLIFGADHGGFEHKNALIEWAKKEEIATRDCGAYALDSQDDYPQYAKAVAQTVLQKQLAGEKALGVLLCRSGGGMCIAANRFPGIRAVSATNTEMAYHARAHNNANVLVLSGDWSNQAEMVVLLQAFIDTPFSKDPRHVRRNSQIDQLAVQYSLDIPQPR